MFCSLFKQPYKHKTYADATYDHIIVDANLNFLKTSSQSIATFMISHFGIVFPTQFIALLSILLVYLNETLF